MRILLKSPLRTHLKIQENVSPEEGYLEVTILGIHPPTMQINGDRASFSMLGYVFKTIKVPRAWILRIWTVRRGVTDQYSQLVARGSGFALH